MSQLSHEFPEEYVEIARLPPSQQNAAERALADRLMGHGRMSAPLSPAGDDGIERVTKLCRDCGAEFKVPAEHAKSGSKWYSLCGSCIQYEL